MEEFEDLRERNFIVAKEAHEAGKKIVGTYCAYAPQELVLAAGAYPVSSVVPNRIPFLKQKSYCPRVCAI